jgi:hypothetical protein
MRRTSTPPPTAPAHAQSSARWWLWPAWGCLALCWAVLTIPYPGLNTDSFIQLSSGRYFWQHGLPQVDPFTYTGQRPYVEPEWLACLLFHFTYTTMGVTGMVALKSVLKGLAVLLALRTARGLGASWSVIALLAPGLLYVFAWQNGEQPRLFTSVFAVAYVCLFVHVREGRLSPRWLWVIPLLHILWANLHGGWLMGTALVACLACGETLHWCRARAGSRQDGPALPGRTVGWLVMVLAACLAAVWVNPYGWALIAYPVHQVSDLRQSRRLEKGGTAQSG